MSEGFVASDGFARIVISIYTGTLAFYCFVYFIEPMANLTCFST